MLKPAGERPMSGHLVALGLAFTALVGLSLAWNLGEIRRHAVAEALTEARGIFDLNLAYRRWNAAHGGVYVPVTPQYRPNPLLVHPRRDLTADDGTALTLVNPAMMTREVHALLTAAGALPVINKVTSLKALNPANAPDEWEAAALRGFEAGAKESTEVVTVGGEPYLRLLRPYYTEQGCLGCHIRQGYRLGDVRGGLSVGVPMRPYLDFAAGKRRTALLSHLAVWVAGMLGLVLLGRRARRAEEQLVTSEWRFRTLAESASDWEYWLGDDGAIGFSSPSSQQVTGYAPEEFVADPDLVRRIVHPEDRPRWEEHLRDRHAAPHAEVLMRIVTKAGETRWVSHSCDPILIGGRRVGRRVSNRDVTDRELAERELRRWGRIFEHAGWGIAVHSADGRTLETMNDAFARMHGWTVEELRGRPMAEVLAPEALEGMAEKLRLADEHGHVTLECRHRRRDGSEFPALCDITSVRGPDGAVAFRVVNAQDLTEKHRLEDQLRQAQKMEAIGQLAGGVAHDFNNILTAIDGYASLLELKMPPADPLRAHVREILAAAERATGLTRGLLAFSRKQPVDLRPLELGEVVRGFQKILARLIGEDIAFTVACAAQELPVQADRGQLEQVLMNLVTNARDAMPRGGRLQIATGRVEFSEGQAEVQPGAYAQLSVTDTGVGIAPSALEHIFEPFFTTKGVGKGTGLGLAIVYGIVKKHGGWVHVYSEPGVGTSFKIFLPLRDAAADSPAAPAATDLPRGTETVLVVEDDPETRKVARLLLEEFGYTVLEAGDGAEALALATDPGRRIDLVLSDVVMPGRNGRETVADLRRLRPGLPAIFMSGYPADAFAEKGVLDPGVPYLQKPLATGELLRLLRRTLAGG